jgi:hypothetical protein
VIGGREDRPEDEGRSPRQVDQEVRDQRDRRRGAQNEPYGEKQDRPEVGAQLERRGEEGCRAQERRQEDDEDHLGGDLDVRQPRYEADAEPPKTRKIG